MTPQEKTIANKLLADFDGLETHPIKKGDIILLDYRNNEVDYSEDWNLLMSCCKKINEHTTDGFSKYEKCKYWEHIEILDDSITKLYRKKDSFSALYYFIQFLNHQKELNQCNQPT